MASGSSWVRGSRHIGPFARNLIGFATWLPVIIWFQTTVGDITMINGPSMSPYFNTNFNETLRRDWVWNHKLYAQQNLRRGMIVTLRSPVHPEVVSVKRIIGLEGDSVHTRKPFPNPYIQVPRGHIWVEGDGEPGQTLDSNTYGPVSVALVTGRITHILLPFRKAGRVRWWEHVDRPRSPR